MYNALPFCFIFRGERVLLVFILRVGLVIIVKMCIPLQLLSRFFPESTSNIDLGTNNQSNDLK
jgi:hypothetical protein